MSIEGKTIVFTGKISKPRYEFQMLVEEHGGIAGSDVSKNTDYLVVGEKPGSKLMRATMLGIKTITERDFVTLLQDTDIKEKVEGEVPLTSEEFAELEKHIVTLTCAWCNKEYRQWDTLPDTRTCPVCYGLSYPLCPHCEKDPIYVEDFNLYHCMVCGIWFKAPCSFHTRKTLHIHLWCKTTTTPKKIITECPCGATLTTSNEYPWEPIKKYEPSSIIERCRRDRQRWVLEQNRIWGEKERKQQKREEEALEFVKSLSQEQILEVENGRFS